MKALFVFAHPDDESFAAGGTIALLVKNGAEVAVVTATRGEAGKCGEPPLCLQEELGSVREQELREAGKVLGIQKIYFLDFIDGTLINIPQNTLAQKITPILESENPDIMITFDKTGITNHPDHIAIGQAATAALEASPLKGASLYQCAFPRSAVVGFEEDVIHAVFGRVEGTPDADITTRIDVAPVLSQKEEALQRHRTQQADLRKYLRGAMNSILRTECFRLVHGDDKLQALLKT